MDHKETCKVIDNLIVDLLEAHNDELTTQHHGDTHAEGEAPTDCSYCLHIDEARQIIAQLEAEVRPEFTAAQTEVQS